MTLDVVIEAKVVDLDKSSAERLDKRIRLLVGQIGDNLTKLHELVKKANRGNIHAALGFQSWTAYLADVFTVQVRLELEQRREVVSYLSGEGMSQRAIADVVGVSKNTVTSDLREVSQSGTPEPRPTTGLDGKTYERIIEQRKRRPGEQDDGNIFVDYLAAALLKNGRDADDHEDHIAAEVAMFGGDPWAGRSKREAGWSHELEACWPVVAAVAEPLLAGEHVDHDTVDGLLHQHWEGVL